MAFVLCRVGHLFLEHELSGLCPQCLLAVPPSPLTTVGPYERLKKLGEGGFGCVYLARRIDGNEHVALKVLRNAQFADAADIARLLSEIGILLRLRSDRIVRILDVGEDQGVPFFTMEYMEGGTLRQRLHEYLDSPERAAALVIEIARGVQDLHGDPNDPSCPPVLHRDLKPENILFDGAGRPKISDFGIAKLATEGRWTQGTHRCGCPAYMAPESARDAAHQPLTAAADVYSLGAILYELFTGQPPFVGTDTQVLARLQSAEPELPRRINPRLDRFLETVVLNALEKDPARRYGSARAFAEDLRRALGGKPPDYAPAVPAAERAWSFLRRRRRASAIVTTSLALAIGESTSLYAAEQSRRDALERQARENASFASSQAVAFKFQLREYAHRLARLSQEPEILALLGSPTIASPSEFLIKQRGRDFDTMFVLARNGRQLARTTKKPDDYLMRSFGFRDYFRGAQALGIFHCVTGSGSAHTVDSPPAYIARTHVSESDGKFEFAISAPVCTAGKFVGIVGGTIASNRGFGSVRLADAGHAHAGRITTLIGPRDVERQDVEARRSPPDGFNFIVHPDLTRGKEYKLEYPEPKEIRETLGLDPNAPKLRYVKPLTRTDYRDPITREDGRWVAAFAPVDESDFVVIVQSPHDESDAVRLFLRSLAAAALISVALGIVLYVLLGAPRSKTATT